mmetsp:Transcript_170383/g.541220  ORF Transcript_170383/g.541220 Transcript_170383/m.541220 type:complete len:534 (+) Transcript_170383:70-1671(+)
MGNAPLNCHGDLVHVRGWTKDQIAAVTTTVRRNGNMCRLTKDEFARYFGGRSREILLIFNDLDTDADGLVDVFEVITVLCIWSGTSWDDTKELLFDLFDLMGKGWMKIDELILMGTIIAQAVSKFSTIDAGLHKHATLERLLRGGVSSSDWQISRKSFNEWADTCEPLGQLRHFVEDHAARRQPETAASRKRHRIMLVEQHAAKLYQRIARLQEMISEFTDAVVDYVSAYGRRKRWDFLMQNIRHLIWKMQEISTSMHTTLVDLDNSVNEEEASGGTASIVDPRKRFQQERMLQDLEGRRLESLNDYNDVTDLLERLIVLTEPNMEGAAFSPPAADSLNVITEVEGESLLDVAPPRIVEHRRQMRQLHFTMNGDIQEGGCFFRPPMQDVPPSGSQISALEDTGVRELFRKTKENIVMAGAAKAVGALSRGGGAAAAPSSTQASRGGPLSSVQGSGQPTMMCIADFEPPGSHASQMLKLQVGDEVTVLGQDGRGWWFGRKENGREGWFPPSYVQLAPAHFTSGADHAAMASVAA